MQTFKIKGEFIQLNQLLKAIGWCDTGADANSAIDNGNVKVNGETEFRKRNKIMRGFKVEFNNRTVLIN